MEAEVFLIGQWRDFDDLESNLSMSELTAILGATREKEKREQKFNAALQGVDLDNEQQDAAQAFEAVKARVLNRGGSHIDIDSSVDYVEADENFSWV